MVLPSTGEILSWDKKVDFAEVVVRYCSLAPLWLTKDDKIARTPAFRAEPGVSVFAGGST